MKKIILYMLMGLVIASLAFAVPDCNIKGTYPFTSSSSPVPAQFSYICVGNKNITDVNVTCSGSLVSYITNTNTSFYSAVVTTSILANSTTSCTFRANDTTVFNKNFTMQALYTPPPYTAFAQNSCPSTTSDVLLYLGVLGFFVAMLYFSAKERMGFIGILCSFALILYSFMIVGCFMAFGVIFGGIGIITLAYFAFGNY